MAFEPHQAVRTRAQSEDGHTRLPKYLQHRNGRIVNVVGRYPFADDRARGRNGRDEVLYTVEFDEGTHAVRADLFEPYLEAAE